MSAQRQYRLVEFVVHYVYLTTMFLNGGLFLFLPRRAPVSYAQYQPFFLAMVGIVSLTFPIAFLVYRKMASPRALSHLHAMVGAGKASASFKVGCIALTCLGDFSGVMGASLFTFTRDPHSLPLFLGSWAVQYAFTAFVARRGRRWLASLESPAIPFRRSA